MPTLTIASPTWLDARVKIESNYSSTIEQMRLVIDLALENVERQTGGPFAAAIFESDSGRLLATGVNSVMRLNNPVMHAEVMAIMFATDLRDTYHLTGSNLPACELVSSCEPCAMCLGATLWSGVRRLVYGANREEATKLGFEEGPVFPESYVYLLERGITILPGVLREEALRPLERYRELGGFIYNG